MKDSPHFTISHIYKPQIPDLYLPTVCHYSPEAGDVCALSKTSEKCTSAELHLVCTEANLCPFCNPVRPRSQVNLVGYNVTSHTVTLQQILLNTTNNIKKDANNPSFCHLPAFKHAKFWWNLSHVSSAARSQPLPLLSYFTS